MIGWIFLVVVVAALAYIRLAPFDPDRWHKQAYPSGLGARPSDSGYVWREEVSGEGEAKLEALDHVIRNSPRTQKLAGSVAERQITYVTRSRVFGFPDYTTVGIYTGLVEDGNTRYLEINARLRFGKSDLGVNAGRVQGWLAAVE